MSQQMIENIYAQVMASRIEKGCELTELMAKYAYQDAVEATRLYYQAKKEQKEND